jgi:dTDP-4-amino-4,6-dideoxygalactose transaminase
MLVKDLVLSPDKYLAPAYKISPFWTSDLSFNRHLPFSDEIDSYFRERFAGRRFIYCESGRQALHLALQHLGLADRDVVTILTTTGNFYISGCVTREIERFCRWSRRLEPDTKVLLVNHEFGFPHAGLRALRQHGLPIIEDAAHAFASDNEERSLSTIGDFTIYSFPKFFPIQLGGLLVFGDRYEVKEPLSLEAKRYVQKVLSFHLKEIPQTSRRRQDNYRLLARRFEAIGCCPRFSLTGLSVPGVFMFKTERSANLEALKTFMWAHGVESSVFYGEQAFFVPVHARLGADDLDYFFEVTRAFFDEDKR